MLVLESAGKVFAASGSFANMTLRDRKGIAGTFHKLENSNDEVPWGWFGSMVGQGDFKKLVNQPSKALSNALDRIPFEGEVTETAYRSFIRKFQIAFTTAAHKGGYVSRPACL